MNRDEIERALREPGPRESEYQPFAMPAAAGDAQRRQGWRGTLLSAGQMGMITAAVVAGAVLAVLLTTGNLPLPGTHGAGSGSPTPTAIASGDAAARSCRSEDFAWSTDPWGGAAGSRGTTVLARGVSSLAGCEISGRALLVLSDANGERLVAAESPVSAVRVDSGTVLEIGISWSNWCGSDPAGPLSLSLTLPGDNAEVPLVPATDGPGQGSGITAPPCNGPGQPAVLNATDFQLSDRTPPEG